MASALPFAISVAFAGCASTKVETTGTALKEPLCRAEGAKLSALVYWGPQWRPDQKEPPLREAAALRGIQDFFAGSPCVARVDVRRLPAADVPSDAELLRLAAAPAPAPDRVGCGARYRFSWRRWSRPC